ncbi:hypothetical protein [Enemella sp. A6]|uniref:hypothetical protein n=1 Tax=Enemella sp. A6 TaxID=3440152 RepID=UPI003EB9EE5E
MTKCPHCFVNLPPQQLTFMCVGACKPEPDQIASRWHGAPVTWRPMLNAAPQAAVRGVICPRCQGPTRECCPRCHYHLPDEWRHGQATCVALAGARATGKSIYIGVLIKQLELLAEAMETTVRFVTSTSREIYERVYERPLYEARGIIPPTPRANLSDSYQREPLILGLGTIRGVPRYLVLRDVAGEDLENPPDNQPHLGFFQDASAVLFLFDPTQVSEVRDQLRDLIPAQLHEGGDPALVLENLHRLIGPGQPRLGVVLSKFDTMQALRDVEGTQLSRIMSNSGAAFIRDSGLTLGPALNPVDADQLHAEVRSLLQRLGAGHIVTAVERPHSGRSLDHRFFVVSALGAPTDGQNLHDHGIASFRVLDPIRWALQREGVL